MDDTNIAEVLGIDQPQQPKRTGKGSGLIKLTRDDPERLKRIQAQGVAASKEAAAKRRIFRDVVREFLGKHAKDKQGRLVLDPDSGRPMTNRDVIGMMLIEQAKGGDLNAINMTMHFAGEAEGKGAAPEVSAQRPLSTGEAIKLLFGQAVEYPTEANNQPPAEVTEDATAEEVAE